MGVCAVPMAASGYAPPSPGLWVPWRVLSGPVVAVVLGLTTPDVTSRTCQLMGHVISAGGGGTCPPGGSGAMTCLGAALVGDPP